MNKQMRDELNEKGAFKIACEALACLLFTASLCGGMYLMALIERGVL